MRSVFDFGDGRGPVPAHRHENGGGWVANTATAHGDAVVYGDARVSGSAVVGGSARVSGFAAVSGSAVVSGSALVCGSAKVCGSARVGGSAVVSGSAVVGGSAVVSGFAAVGGDARVGGSAVVSGFARVSGSARVYGGVWEISPPWVQIGRWHLGVSAPGEIASGCQVHPASWWAENWEQIAKDHGVTSEELALGLSVLPWLTDCANSMGARDED